MAALRNFNGLVSWRNAENSLQSVNLTMPRKRTRAIRWVSFRFPAAPGISSELAHGPPPVIATSSRRNIGQ